MATGTFIKMSKIRPGAYVNYRAPIKPRTLGDNRGIVAFMWPLAWGPEGEVIKVTAEEMATGASLKKVGVYASMAYNIKDITNEDSLTAFAIERLAFAKSHTALIFRSGKGGEKASKTIGGITCTAKYSGTVGNRISVQIAEKTGGGYFVTTYLDRREVDRQFVTKSEELVANDYIEFGTGTLAASVATKLEGGTNGTESETATADFFAAVNEYPYTCLACLNNDAAEEFTAEVKRMREEVGIKVQAAVYNHPNADYEGVISTHQGYRTTDGIDINAETLMPLLVASLTAGAGIPESLTYYTLPDADVILDDTGAAHEMTHEEIEAALTEGKMVISRRYDRTIVIEQDINTLHTFTAEKSKDFAKNLIIRTLDEINYYIVTRFESAYIGKVQNNALGRQSLRADIVGYLNTLVNAGAIDAFNAEDVDVLPGETKASVIVNLAIKPVDAMEIMYMTVYVG